jgi:precorrin-2/cobalt-factor-2 C20-methyltransferase
MAGRLYGIGVGPGDPELVTLKALRLVRAAAIIAYPAPETGESFARSIVAQWLDGSQGEIAIRFPMRPGKPPEGVYDAAARRLAAVLDEGRDVAFLCQGDPLFYGSFIGVLERLGGRYPTEIVPGISSLTAGAAALRSPLATRGEALSVLPATLDEEALDRLLAAADSAVVIKLGRHLAKLRRVLDRLGLLDRALYIERATLPSERIAPLAEVDPESVPYFSLVLVRRRD